MTSPLVPLASNDLLCIGSTGLPKHFAKDSADRAKQKCRCGNDNDYHSNQYGAKHRNIGLEKWSDHSRDKPANRTIDETSKRTEDHSVHEAPPMSAPIPDNNINQK